MGNLNGTEKIKQFVSEDVIDLGDSIDQDAQIPFEINFVGQKEDIFFMYGGCHCTDAWFEDGNIKGTLNVARSQYDRETGDLTQYVFVYMNDGKDFYLQDPQKRRKSNPEKDWFRITLTGKVNI